MVTEQDKTLEGLRLAVQMEIDGKEYYLKASESSNNQMGKKLFRTLAAEEDTHRQKFEGIYRNIQNKKAWPETDFQPDGGKRLRTIFAKESEEMGAKVTAQSTELDAIRIAMDMENKSHDLYKRLSQEATQDAEKDFYQTVAGEEREHHLVLLD